MQVGALNTTDQVTVNLARRGALDEPSKLLEGRLYSRVLEALEVTPLSRRPDEDSHRLYNIGVANEALAYSSEDVSKASTCLEQQNGPMPMTQAFAFVPQHVHARAQTEPHAEQNLALSRSQENTDFSLGALSTTQASMEHLSIQALAE